MIFPNLETEYIFSIFGIKISNSFFTTLLATFFLFLGSIIFYFKKDSKNIFVYSVKLFVKKTLNLVESTIEDKKIAKKLLPLIASFFIFILFSNLLGLLPGFLGAFFVETEKGKVSLFRSPSSDLTTTLALAIFAVFSIQVYSISSLGIKKYLLRFFNFLNPIKLILGFFELLSEFTKVLSFSFRLFGNIFAGEVLLLVVAFIFPFFLPLPFLLLETFVGVIQAFIFAILTLTFIKSAIFESRSKENK